MTLLVQKYLETHTLAQLKLDHGVNARIAGHKFSLNYDMIEASNTDPIASQCRGVVLGHDVSGLDENVVVGQTVIYARTMPRFFNQGQECAAVIDFEAKDTKFYEKLDGTMCALYWDPTKLEWCVSTRSVPEADLPIDGFDNLTFRGLFEKAVKETTGQDFDDWVDFASALSDATYIFELCTPANRIVVEHFDYKVTLLAVINRLTGEETPIESFNGFMGGVSVCQTYRLNSMKEMIEFVSDRNPTEYEGIVAVDKNFNRVKVKNPGYLALSRIKDSALRSPRSLVELCLLGKLDDALPLLPDHIVERAHKIQEALRGFIRDSEGSYVQVGGAAINMCDSEGWDPDDPKVLRKAMALSAQKAGAWMPYIMQRLDGRVNGFWEFVLTQIDPQTGQYKKNFLETLLEKLDA